MTINKENMRKWVRALRSGVFEQTTGALCVLTQDGKRKYCCLGVACEVARIDGLDLAVKDSLNIEDDERRPDGLAYGEEQNTGTLPREVQEWLGFTYDAGNNQFANPEVPWRYLGEDRLETASLTNLNDNMNQTFEQIADVIEKTFLQEDAA